MSWQEFKRKKEKLENKNTSNSSNDGKMSWEEFNIEKRKSENANINTHSSWERFKNKKESEENTTKIRNNNNQEKSIASKILDPLSFIGEKTIAGTFRNIVGIPQAGLTDIANNLEKGEQKSTLESTTDFLTSLLSFTNPLQPLNNAIKDLPENISNTIDIL